jgi:hypothetical protein
MAGLTGMAADEQNELQEGGHATSFLGSMFAETLAKRSSAGAHASRVQRSASRGLPVCHEFGSSVNESVGRESGDGFWRDAKISTRDACAPLVLLILLLSFGMARAQVGADVVDLNKGLVAKWDGPLAVESNSHLKLPEAARGMKLSDFAVTFAVHVNATQHRVHGPHVISFLASPSEQSVVGVLSADGMRFVIDDISQIRRTDFPGAVRGVWVHVALNVKRDARQALAGGWLNGVEVTSWKAAPRSVLLSDASFDLASMKLEGQIANLRLYNRALNRPEILELAAMPPMAALKPKLEPFPSSMKLMTEEVIAVLGGTEAVAMMEDGTMEALLMTQFPGSRVKVRNLAWEADTVFRMDRPMNFGGLKQQIQRAQATSVMLMFGRQECLERDEAGLAEFRAALEKMVTTCAEVTPRLVLVEPLPFEGDLSNHNATLKKYAAVMAEVVKAHGALFAAQKGELKPGATRDGLNLTSTGAAQLGMSLAKLWGGDAKAPDARLKALIGQKNTLWHRYWRPANWAFLHGDRTAQPSSRDHTDPTQRWFPGEVEQYKPLIEAKENEIWKLANDLGGKLP